MDQDFQTKIFEAIDYVQAHHSSAYLFKHNNYTYVLKFWERPVPTLRAYRYIGDSDYMRVPPSIRQYLQAFFRDIEYEWI